MRLSATSGYVVLGVFLFLLCLLIGFYMSLVSLIGFVGREPSVSSGILAALLALVFFCLSLGSLRMSIAKKSNPARERRTQECGTLPKSGNVPTNSRRDTGYDSK